MSYLFSAGQKRLQLGIFSLYVCRVRSPLFRHVVVKLSSTVVEHHRACTAQGKQLMTSTRKQYSGVRLAQAVASSSLQLLRAWGGAEGIASG